MSLRTSHLLSVSLKQMLGYLLFLFDLLEECTIILLCEGINFNVSVTYPSFQDATNNHDLRFLKVLFFS